MITNGKKWHYLALKSEHIFHDGKMYYRPVKSLSRLLRKKTSNHHRDFYCLNYFHSYSTKELCNKNDFCRIEMPKWFEKIIKYNHGVKSLKPPFIICLDLECLLKKMQSCQNNVKNSNTDRKAMHEPSGWVMFTKCSFNKTENKLDYYRGIDCIKTLCEKLKVHALKIINYKEKEMLPLTDE